jgi:hypothetical protein
MCCIIVAETIRILQVIHFVTLRKAGVSAELV